MPVNLIWGFISIACCSIVYMPFVKAGLNHFSKVDTYDDWIIEQKFDPEKNEITCRASRKGYGTWFDEKIRLDKNDQIVFPEGIYRKNHPSKALMQKILTSLEKCRSSLLYFQK